jgi:uncharacterized protein YeaO (DUF488 family)
MSRHTLNDGITPDERIREGISFDEWLKELAPPEKLVGAYYRDEVGWDDYAVAYLAHLRSEIVGPLVQDLARRCDKESVTLLCAEESPDYCHRRILAEEIQRILPEITIIHE